jgi:glycosyltransferase involved in cell wall biosynthesis
VVSTDVSGIPELVQDGRSGLLVASGSVLALADALRKLLGLVALREALAIEARRVVERSFDVSRETAALHSLLRGAAGKSS